MISVGLEFNVIAPKSKVAAVTTASKTAAVKVRTVFNLIDGHSVTFEQSNINVIRIKLLD